MTITWEHRDSWITGEGDGYAVEVRRHTKYNKDNGWCIYAYVQKSHPLFNKLNVGHWNYFEIPAIESLPLHGGCTWFKGIYSDGELVGFEVGADYSHWRDDRFQKYETKEDAAEVFDDAERVFGILQRMRERGAA